MRSGPRSSSWAVSPLSLCLARLPAGASANPWVHVTGSPLCPWPSAFKNPVYYLEERSRPPPHPFWKCPSLRCHKLFLLPTSATAGCNASMFHSACGSHARPCLPSDVSFLRGGVSGLFDILALSETSLGFAHGGRPANVCWMNLVEFFTPSALSGKGYSHWAGSAGMFSDSQAGNGHQEASSSISALRQTQQRPARQMQLLPLGTAPEHPRSGNPPDDAS